LKRILITNDDGYESPAFHALFEALKPLGLVTAVAPTTEKSACGHSLTLTRPLRFIKVDDEFYKLDDGTPTDCIYLAINSMFEDQKPDLIVSGINKGANMGEDITYSGTASGAMEGVLQGVPSIAISQVCNNRCENIDDLEYKLAVQTIQTLAKKILDEGFPLGERKFLNVNIPPIAPEQCKGIAITNAGYRLYGNDAHVHRNPRGQEFYWIGLHPLEWRNRGEMMSDFDAISQNYVSLTPVELDMTSYSDIAKLQAWKI
jgi:5'-nucleotidase